MHALVDGINRSEIDVPLIQALASKWWDTTHTFIFEDFGEMTLTPTDFSAISGLPVYGKVLKMNKRVHRNPNLLRTLVGEPLALLKKSRVEVSWLYSVYKNMPLNTGKDCDRLARVFILALLGSTLFARRNNMVDLYYIPSLQCIADIPNFNWGGAGLAFAYQQMDDLCRLNTHCIGGLWKTWEVNTSSILIYELIFKLDLTCVLYIELQHIANSYLFQPGRSGGESTSHVFVSHPNQYRQKSSRVV